MLPALEQCFRIFSAPCRARRDSACFQSVASCRAPTNCARGPSLERRPAANGTIPPGCPFDLRPSIPPARLPNDDRDIATRSSFEQPPFCINLSDTKRFACARTPTQPGHQRIGDHLPRHSRPAAVRLGKPLPLARRRVAEANAVGVGKVGDRRESRRHCDFGD